MPSSRRPSSDVPAKWIRTRADEVAIRKGCWFDQEAADRIAYFFENFLRHSKGGKFAGKPFKLIPWERDWLAQVFGWKQRNGFRRFTEAYLEIPKKNGKSALASGLAIEGMTEEPGAEVYTGAVNRKQASIVFNEAARMVKGSAALSRHMKVIDSQKRITYASNNATFEAMSSDVPSKDGMDATRCILDELHRFPSDDMYNVLEHAGAARDQPLRIVITTAGNNRHSICYRLHERAKRILDGSDPDIHFLGTIYAASESDDLDDRKVWRKANPSMGTILSEERFATEFARAKRSPVQLANFKRLRFNLWAEESTRWLDVARWDRRRLDLDPKELAKQPCWAAVDLSAVADLTALSLYFPDGDTGYLKSEFFMPAATAEERAEFDHVPYPAWAEEGHLTLTEGNAVDHDAVLAKLYEVAKRYRLLGVGIDPWNAQHVVNELMKTTIPVVEIRQGYRSLSGPSKAFERDILTDRIKHDGNLVMRWCVGNVVVTSDANGNIRPDKKKSNQRIDGVMSAVMARGLAMTATPSAPGFALL